MREDAMAGADTQGVLLSPSARSSLVELLMHGPLSRAELARRLSLSSANLSKTCRPLINAGYLRLSQSAESPPALGRPALPLEVVPDIAFFIGIKLTADRLIATVASFSAEFTDLEDIPLVSQDPLVVMEQIVTVVQTLRNRHGRIRGIGISLAGNSHPDDPDVHESVHLGWREVPIATIIQERTGLPTTLQNDIRALAAAEGWFGAAAGTPNYILITIGIAIGCAITTDGITHDGRRGLAGQIGHIRITDGGPVCDIGHAGCLSAYATTEALSRAIRPGTSMNWEQCLEYRIKNDERAFKAFHSAARAVGVAAAQMTNFIDTDQIIISGAAAGICKIASASMLDSFNQTLVTPEDPPPITVHEVTLADWSLGAAVIAIQEHIRRIRVDHNMSRSPYERKVI